MSVDAEAEEADLAEVARDLGAVAELAADPSRLAEVVEHAVEAASDWIPHTAAALLRLGRGESAVALEAIEGPRRYRRLEGGAYELEDYPALAEALRGSRPRILDLDGVELPPLFTMARDGIEAALLAPVRSPDRALGLLVFLGTPGQGYSTEHEAIAGLYARMLALALVGAAREAELEAARARLQRQAEDLSSELEEASTGPRRRHLFEGASMDELYQAARRVARTDAPVLLVGETGAGKEVLSSRIHSWSGRRGPFLKVNCAALPRDLIEAELFGHVEGAFSGATRTRAGRFVAADGGTLLLDEVGEMPLELQAKLLRVLQEGTVVPIGSDAERDVDVRILAATNVDLGEAVAAGEFREDLFYRLNVMPLRIPPLRERLDELPDLAASILEEIHERTGEGPWHLSDRALEVLRGHTWPGNVRELANTLERARILCPGPELEVTILAPATADGPQEPWPSLEDHQRRYLEEVLRHTRGKIYGDDGAASLLKVPPTTLQSRLKKLGVQREDFKA